MTSFSCLDYDSQKWVMVSLASVAISLALGLLVLVLK
jgi:hypothetical protein